MIFRHKAPYARVGRVVAVIAHHEIVVEFECIGSGFRPVDVYFSVAIGKVVSLVIFDATFIGDTLYSTSESNVMVSPFLVSTVGRKCHVSIPFQNQADNNNSSPAVLFLDHFPHEGFRFHRGHHLFGHGYAEVKPAIVAIALLQPEECQTQAVDTRQILRTGNNLTVSVLCIMIGFVDAQFFKRSADI